MSAKKSFGGANAVDKMKAYLRDVPVLHKRLVKVIEDLDRTLGEARVAKENFEAVTAQIEDTVKRWEEEQRNDGRSSQPLPGQPGPAGQADQPVGDAPQPGPVEPPPAEQPQSGG